MYIWPAVTFLWFNHEVRVVMGAVHDNMQAPHTRHCAHCDLLSAHTHVHVSTRSTAVVIF